MADSSYNNKDNNYIISGSRDHTLIIWNIKKKSRESILLGYTNSVWSIAITSDDKFIISTSWDLTIRVWSFQNRAQVYVYISRYS